MKVITGIIIGMLMALNAEAGFIKHDWANDGDQLVSVDTNTSLAWLSPSLFFGVSWNEVQDRLDTDPLYRGYRFASIDEYLNLVGENGLDLFASPAFDNPVETARFLDHFALNGFETLEALDLIVGEPIRGLSGAPEDEDRYFIYTSEVLFDSNTMFFASLLDARYHFPDRSLPSRSYLLVREVPEPSMMFSFMLGLSAVAYRNRRLLRKP